MMKREAVFLKIWLSIFCTSLATFLLLMSLSAVVITRTGSAALANIVVLTQWIPAVLALPLIRSLVARRNARQLLVQAEFGAVLSIVLIPVAIDNTFAMLALLIAKGTFDNLSKVSRPVALKQLFDGSDLARAASYYNTAMLVGGGVGSLIGAALLGRLALGTIVAVCCALHMLSAVIYLTVRERRPADRAAASGATSTPTSEQEIWQAIVYFVASVALFQGFHNIARSVFAVHQMHMASTGIPILQAVTNGAYVIGAFVAARVSLEKGRYAMAAVLSHVFALLTLLPLVVVTGEQAGVFAYGVFAFGFELAYCVHLRYLILAVPGERLPRVMANANAWALGLMLSFSIAGSFLAERVSFGSLAFGTGLVAVCVPIAIQIVKAVARREPIRFKGEAG
ncbi:MFS transporter [Burkholderia gladioli]|uniref:MFS transporter n=1 Tax=Burkholderia gladioli TaxID=28095 RepID=UPI00163FF19F|nr:MFS transporter [Burkholderia gladioli]